MVRVVSRRCAVALVTLAFLGWPFQAAAQPSSLPPNVIAPSAENSVIRNQLVLAKKFEQQALQGYMALPGDNSVSIDPVSYQAARDAYILIRAARHGMGWQRDAKKFADPVFDLTYKRLNDAWNLARTPVDHPTHGEQAVRDATQAIRLLDQVLAMMP